MDFSREFIFIDILKISVTLGLIPQYLASWLYGKIKPHGKFPLCFRARPLPRPACHLVAAPAPRVHPHVSIWGRFYPRRLYPTGLSNLHCSLTRPTSQPTIINKFVTESGSSALPSCWTPSWEHLPWLPWLLPWHPAPSARRQWSPGSPLVTLHQASHRVPPLKFHDTGFFTTKMAKFPIFRFSITFPKPGKPSFIFLDFSSPREPCTFGTSIDSKIMYWQYH